MIVCLFDWIIDKRQRKPKGATANGQSSKQLRIHNAVNTGNTGKKTLNEDKLITKR